jgi:hypothetical protein
MPCPCPTKEEAEFVALHLGPTLRSIHPDVQIFIYDHNKDRTAGTVPEREAKRRLLPLANSEHTYKSPNPKILVHMVHMDMNPPNSSNFQAARSNLSPSNLPSVFHVFHGGLLGSRV